MLKRAAVFGTGAGGRAVAVDLTLGGCQVHLAELPRFEEAISPIREKGGLEVFREGEEAQFVALHHVTTDIPRAVAKSEALFIVVPCFGHEPFSLALAPHLRDGQTVCFFGEGSGTLVLRKALRDRGQRIDLLLGETNTLPYHARLAGPTGVSVRTKRGGVIAAALPARGTDRLLRVLQPTWPFIREAENVFETVLLNFNAIDHVATMVANAGAIEGGRGEMRLWGEGATPSVVRCIEAVDREIFALRKALGLKNETPYKDWLHQQGFLDAPQETCYEAIHKSVLARGTIQRGPGGLQIRYLTEDVPYALVLISSLGAALGVKTPVIDALVTMASTLNGEDYRKAGRTLSSLGFSGQGAEALHRFLESG